MPKTMISARVDDEIHASLDQLAEATKRSKAFLIADALETYVKQQAWQMRKIDDAFREADETGEFISHEAVEKWLTAWTPKNRLPPPEPDVFKKPRRS
jgi:predicted transcriptional regulator